MSKVAVHQTGELDFQSRVRWLNHEVELLRSWTDAKDKSEVITRLNNISHIVFNIKESLL